MNRQRQRKEQHRQALRAHREHRESREQKQREHFIQPLTGKQAWHRAGAEAATEFNPVIRGKSAEIRGSNRREHELGDWYNQLAQSDLTAQQNAIQAYSAAQAAQTAQMNAASQQGGQALQNLAANDAAAAARYGGPVNTTGLAGIAASNNELNAQRANIAAPLAGQGANNVAYAGSRVNTAGLAGIQARGVQHRETLKDRQERAALVRERGQAKVANVGKIRENEENRQTAKEAFNYERGQNSLQARTEAEERAEAAAQNARQERREERELRNSEGERKEGRASNRRQEEREEKELENETFKTHHPGSGGNGLTPSEKKTRKENWQDAKATVRSLWPTVKTSKKFLSLPPNSRWSVFEQFVREEGVDPHLAHRAVQALRQQIEGNGGGTGNAQGGIHR